MSYYKKEYPTVKFVEVVHGQWDAHLNGRGARLGSVCVATRWCRFFPQGGGQSITIAQLRDISLFMSRRERSRK